MPIDTDEPVTGFGAEVRYIDQRSRIIRQKPDASP